MTLHDIEHCIYDKQLLLIGKRSKKCIANEWFETLTFTIHWRRLQSIGAPFVTVVSLKITTDPVVYAGWL
jgi:hypothetical protein